MNNCLKKTLGTLVLGSAIVLGSHNLNNSYSQQFTDPRTRQEDMWALDHVKEHGLDGNRKERIKNQEYVIGAGILLMAVAYVLTSMRSSGRPPYQDFYDE